MNDSDNETKISTIFRNIFGKNKFITIHFLETILKLDGKRSIKNLEYFPFDHQSFKELEKENAINVKYTDYYNSIFIVKSRLIFKATIIQYTLFNSINTYSSYINDNLNYKLMGVISINIVDDFYNISNDNTTNYHHYKMGKKGGMYSIIPGIEEVCIELPTFKPSQNPNDKMLNLWQYFLILLTGRAKLEDMPDEFFITDIIKKVLKIYRQNLPLKEQNDYDFFLMNKNLKYGYNGNFKRIHDNKLNDNKKFNKI